MRPACPTVAEAAAFSIRSSRAAPTQSGIFGGEFIEPDTGAVAIVALIATFTIVTGGRSNDERHGGRRGARR